MTNNIIRKQAWQWMLILTLLGVFTLPTQAAIPDNVDYQGYLTDSGGSPTNGIVSITFSIYNVSGGGLPLWADTQAVTVTNGLFNTKLAGPFPAGMFDAPLWLGIDVASDGEMMPRIELSSAAFAHKADDAYTLEGISASSLDQSAHVGDTTNSHNVTAAQTGAVSSANFALHTSDASAHHAKTSNFTELSGQTSDAQIPVAIARDSEIMPTVFANDGPGSGLNADLLDGLNSTAFMSVGADNWVNITGDTMTGDLNVLANVGISTATPDESLTVGDTADTVNRNIRIRSQKDVALILQSDTDNIDESDNPYIQFLQDGDVVDGVIGLSGGSNFGPDGTAMTDARANALVIANKFSGARIQFMTNNGVDVGNRMSITGSGDVGIGTITPGEKLHVKGDFRVEGGTQSSISLWATGSGSDQSAWFTHFPNYLFVVAENKNDLSDKWLFTVNKDGNVGINAPAAITTLEVWANAGTHAASFMNGNVGIGTESPQSKLHVVGNLRVSSMPFGDRRNVQWDDTTGLFYYDNSSYRYKENIKPLEDNFDALLETEPKTYTRPGDPSRWEIGYIAEEFHELGLTKLVDYDAKGHPDGINYEKISLYLIEIIKKQQAQIDALEEQFNALR